MTAPSHKYRRNQGPAPVTKYSPREYRKDCYQVIPPATVDDYVIVLGRLVRVPAWTWYVYDLHAGVTHDRLVYVYTVPEAER